MLLMTGLLTPTLGSWSSGLEKSKEWLKVIGARLLLRRHTVFFTTWPGWTAPSFTTLLRGSTTVICGSERRSPFLSEWGTDPGAQLDRRIQ